MVEQKQEAAQWLGELIQDGFYDKLVIIGFPYDEGAKKAGARSGSDYGPDSFRRFVTEIGSVHNPEYDVDISKGLPKISDYGNIQIEPVAQPDGTWKKPTMQELYQKLATKVGLCLKRQNIPFVIGGSRDLFQSITDAYLAHSKNLLAENPAIDHQVTFLSISPALDLKPLLEENRCHQTSRTRYLLERLPSNFRVVQYGVDGSRVSQNELVYWKSKATEGSKVKYLSKIRKTGFAASWSKVLQNLKNKDSTATQVIHVSFNLEAIAGVAGVSTNCLSGGFSTEESIQMVYDLGKELGSTGALASFDLCEYNPYVEDWRTGRIVASLFYYFSLGLSEGLQQSSSK